MARRGAARGRDRGGGSVQTTRTGPRLATATTAVAIAAGVVVYAGWTAHRLVGVVAVAGLAGLLLLALGVATRRAVGITLGLAGVGAAYVVSAWTKTASVPVDAPVVAAGLIAAAEFAFWSLERLVARDEHGVAARRAALVLVIAVAAVFVGSVLLVPAAASVHLGIAGDVLGVVAAVAAVALALAVARRTATLGVDG